MLVAFNQKRVFVETSKSTAIQLDAAIARYGTLGPNVRNLRRAGTGKNASSRKPTNKRKSIKLKNQFYSAIHILDGNVRNKEASTAN